MRDRMSSNFVLENIDGLWFGYAPKLRAQGIQHAFTTRLRGQSRLAAEGLNMSLNVGDEEDFVLANRQQAMAALGLDFARLTAARQVHSDNCWRVTEQAVGRGHASFTDALPDTDALFTDLPAVPLMLLFADCVPIILADPAKRMVAVVHAGWRGTLAGVLQKALARLKEEALVCPEDCWAVIGPSIGPCCYQVGEQVYVAAQPGQREFFREVSPGQWNMDLYGLNQAQLEAGGVKGDNVVVSGVCTNCNRELFFSHRGEQGKAGRFAALAWL